jgi:flagellar basal-body rod protein FlgG
MLRGYYTAASGISVQEKKLNTYASNAANVSTVGYKKDNLVSGVFGEHLAVRLNQYHSMATNNIGPGVFMQVVDEKYTDHNQGAFTMTDRPMDLAIEGDGFFVIAREDGEFLTRDGQFSLDEEGYLELPGYGRVLGEGGEIQIGTAEFYVDGFGNIYAIPFDSAYDEEVEAELIDTLQIVDPAVWETMDKTPEGFYNAPEGFAQVDFTNTRVLQGRLENSNVNMAEEMTRVMYSQRSLQSCSQIVKMYDEMADKITTQISRV